MQKINRKTHKQTWLTSFLGKRFYQKFGRAKNVGHLLQWQVWCQRSGRRRGCASTLVRNVLERGRRPRTEILPSLSLTRLTTGTCRPRRGEDSRSDQMDDRVETKSVTDRLTRIHSSLCHHVRQLDEEGRKITSREEDKMINYLNIYVLFFRWRPLNLLKDGIIV